MSELDETVRAEQLSECRLAEDDMMLFGVSFMAYCDDGIFRRIHPKDVVMPSSDEEPDFYPGGNSRGGFGRGLTGESATCLSDNLKGRIPRPSKGGAFLETYSDPILSPYFQRDGRDGPAEPVP